MSRLRFVHDREASVGAHLALLAIPLFGFVGAAVDFSRASSTRTAMHSALDATALMLSKDAPTLSLAELNQRSTDTFRALFDRPEADAVQVSSELVIPQEGNYSLKLTGSGSVRTAFTRLLGHPEIAFSATSEVLWGIKKLELALVLDNTGSMQSSGKMTALKQAAQNLLTTLKNAAKQPGDIKVAVVPFAVAVNAGTANANASWIDWTDWEAANGTCSRTSYTTKSSCISNGRVWTPAARSTWNGCVNDRDQNNDVLNTAPLASAPATLFRANQAANCPAPAMPLSEDWTALSARIDAMTPTGNTNTTIGLAWGWQMITPSAPFHASPPKPDLDKVIVMLTDGENTQNRWTTSATSINARTTTICNNIKAENVKIYTVRVIDGNANLIKGCASKPTMYYDVDEAVELNSVFASIAQNLANLRITR